MLDEADRLLEIGFKEELDLIIRSCPPRRTTMLFSATMTGWVESRRLHVNPFTHPPPFQTRSRT